MRRIAELDALRGIAAVAIVAFHLRFKNSLPLLGTSIDLFFVLSGYLITTILLRTRESGRFFSTFYARRSLRIWPIYYLSFPAFLVLNRWLPNPSPLDGLPYYLTYTQFVPAYWGGAVPPFSHLYLHTWTLAVEEQFYLLWPLLVRLSGRRFLPMLALPLLVVPFVLRARGVFSHLLLTRCDGLALGALVAWLLYDGVRLARRKTAFSIGFAAAALLSPAYPVWGPFLLGAVESWWPALPWHRISISLGKSMIGLFYTGIVGLVLVHQGHPRLAFLRGRRLCRTGQISYGLYLYHPFVFAFMTLAMQGLGVRGSALMDVLKFAACFAVAALSWRFVERPILAMKDRFTYGETRGAEALRGPHVPAVAAPESTGRERL